MAIGSRFDAQKFFLSLLLSFVAIQVVSFLLAEFTDFPLLKLGWVLFLFLIISVISMIFITSTKIGSLDLKRDLPFILIQFALIVLVFIYAPKILPQIFSSQSFDISQTLGAIVG